MGRANPEGELNTPSLSLSPVYDHPVKMDSLIEFVLDEIAMDGPAGQPAPALDRAVNRN